MMTTPQTIKEKLEHDYGHFLSMAKYARENKKYAVASHLRDMADYVQILKRYLN